MRALIAYDQFLRREMFQEALLDRMKDLAAEIDVVSYEVKASDTPPDLPKSLDHLTFGNPQDLVDRIRGVDILLVHKAPVTSAVFGQADSLKAIGCARAGPGNVDIEAATRSGVPVFYAPGRNANAVAELTIGLILSEMRHLSRAQGWLRAGKWTTKSPPTDLFPGHELRGKTIGIIGVGHIGRIVANLAEAFGMRVLGYDPYVDPMTLATFGVEPVDFDRLLSSADVVSLHLRLSGGQKHVIGRRELGLMKNSAYLVNTSDGPVIDDEALFEAIRSHRIAGAAQDSWLKKPVTLENPWLSLENSTVTPGLGGGTVEVPVIGIEMIVEGIAAYLSGEEPRFVRNPEVIRR